MLYVFALRIGECHNAHPSGSLMDLVDSPDGSVLADIYEVARTYLAEQE
jgi:hypothetical protein